MESVIELFENNMDSDPALTSEHAFEFCFTCFDTLPDLLEPLYTISALDGKYPAPETTLTDAQLFNLHTEMVALYRMPFTNILDVELFHKFGLPRQENTEGYIVHIAHIFSTVHAENEQQYKDRMYEILAGAFD